MDCKITTVTDLGHRRRYLGLRRIGDGRVCHNLQKSDTNTNLLPPILPFCPRATILSLNRLKEEDFAEKKKMGERRWIVG